MTSDAAITYIALVQPRPDGAVDLIGFKNRDLLGTYRAERPVSKSALTIVILVALAVTCLSLLWAFQLGTTHGRNQAYAEYMK